MKRVRKTVASPLLLSVLIIIILMGLAIFLFFFTYSPAWEQMKERVWMCVAVVTFFGCIPIALFFAVARKFFSIICIDEKGISRSLFRKFFKLFIKWDEIYEIRYYESALPFILFSQNKSMQGVSYNGTAKIKDLIQLQLTQKNYDAIKQYIKQPIIGLTDTKKAQLKLRD